MSEQIMNDTNSVQNIGELSTNDEYKGRIAIGHFRKVFELTKRGKRGILLYRLGDSDQQRRMAARNGQPDKVYFGIKSKEGQAESADPK